MALSDTDRRVLNVLQTGLPLVPRPFQVMAAQLGMSEEQLLTRLAQLRAAGYIRRLGPFFDSSRLGYVSTLVAVRAEATELAAVAQWVNGHAGVTHNYQRTGRYNLWFTLITGTLAEQTAFLSRLAKQPGVRDIINIPATRRYKVNVVFELKESKQGEVSGDE